MRTPTKLIMTSIAVMLLLAAAVSAQRNPAMAGQQRDREKESRYASVFQLMKGRSAEEQRLAYEAGKEYLRRFEGDNDADARTVRKFVDEYEKTLGDFQIFAAYDAGDYAKTFELGQKRLAVKPENFFVLSVLAEAGYDKAQAGDKSLNAETIDYLRRAINVLEGGKVSQPNPFKSMGMAHGFLNFALALFIKDQAPVEAAAALRKAAASDSPYREDPLVYHRMGAAILKGEFQQVSSEYNLKYGATSPSAEQRAMLDRVLKLGDRATDAYARAVALSTKPEQQPFKAKLMEQLTALYKSLHNNSDAGLNEMITSVLSKPLP